MHIQQHDAETRTLGHNNAEVVLRFCLPKLTAVVNSSCAGPFLCFWRMLHVTISWKCAFSSMMQKQGHALVKARGFLGSVCVCLTSLLWCFDMCYWRPLLFGTAGNQLGQLWSMYRSSPFRSTLNTGYITGLGMCKVCTEAVHSVALWTRVTLQVWACVKYVPTVHSVALWTRVTLQPWACVKYAPKQSIP